MSEERKHRVCPVERAKVLDLFWRKLLQNPGRILRPYIKEGMTVLDLGCGPGFFTLEMARLVGKTGKVVAADLQQGMLDKAEKKIAAAGLADVVTFHLCPGNGIGLAKRFDFILVFYMLHEAPDPGAFLSELRSLLKPSGRVLLAEPSFHVSRGEFQKSIGLMTRAGLEIVAEPVIFLSRAVVLMSIVPER